MDPQFPASCLHRAEGPGRSDKEFLFYQSLALRGEAKTKQKDRKLRAPWRFWETPEEGQWLQTKSPLLNSCVCTCACVCVHAHIHTCTSTYFRPGAPPRRAGEEVTSASRCSCRSISGGRTPGRGCPSGPGAGSTCEQGEGCHGRLGLPLPAPLDSPLQNWGPTPVL